MRERNFLRDSSRRAGCDTEAIQMILFKIPLKFTLQPLQIGLVSVFAHLESREVENQEVFGSGFGG